MLYYPEVQKKAHEELDRVLGGTRLPEFKDEQDMPYIAAIVKEIIRWRVAVPLGTCAAQFAYFDTLLTSTLVGF